MEMETKTYLPKRKYFRSRENGKIKDGNSVERSINTLHMPWQKHTQTLTPIRCGGDEKHTLIKESKALRWCYVIVYVEASHYCCCSFVNGACPFLSVLLSLPGLPPERIFFLISVPTRCFIIAFKIHSKCLEIGIVGWGMEQSRPC